MWSYTLLPKVLNMSLTASIVIVLVLLARLLLRKSPKIFSYALWAVVLFRLLCPVSFSSEFSLLGFFHPPAVATGDSGTYSSITYIPGSIVHMEYPEAAMQLPGISDAVNESLPQDHKQLVVSSATLLWLLGIAVMLTYSAASLILLRRKLTGAVRLRNNIYLADHIATPFVIGLLRPKIYLPSSVSEQEQGYIILHEQIHIRRFDHIIKMIAFLALAVHWFNPLVWVAFICAGKDMEMSCDELVLKKAGAEIKKAYSMSLLSLTAGRPLINGSPLAFGEGNIKERIKNVMNFKKPANWVIAVSVVLVAALIIGFAANRTEGNKDRDSFSEALQAAEQSVRPEDITVPDSGISKKTATDWMAAYFEMLKALPKDNMAHITEGAIDNLEIKKVSKPGLQQAFVFSVTFSVKPTYPIAKNPFWMAGNTGNSPGKDETWGQLYREVELRLEGDGRYHFVEMGAGGVGHGDEYESYGSHVSVRVEAGDNIPEAVIDYAKEYVANQVKYYNEVGQELSFSIIDSKITGLKHINTGTASLNKDISLWLLEYRLLPDDASKVPLAGGMRMEESEGKSWLTEWGSTGQPYLLLVRDDSGTETTWQHICVTNTDVITVDYGTTEMLERYGNEYTAAAMLLYQKFLESSGTNINTNDLDEAVRSAFLQNNQGRYYSGECIGEGHIILGHETDSGNIKVYTLTMYGEYGFEDGNFVKVSGSGIIPAVFTFTNSGNGLVCTKIEYPEDGAGYGKSIRKLFPPAYVNKALSPSDGDRENLKAQERSYAKSYLKKIGRNAVIGDYGDFEHTLLTDAGISVKVSNSINDKLFANYPMWIGNREVLENGIRYVYEMSYNKEAHEIILKKYEYDTGKIVELTRLDSTTGLQLAN